MKLAIVGSCSLAGNQEAYAIIREILFNLKPDWIVSGGAKGIDSMARECAKEQGIEMIEFLPESPNWHTGYKPRNIQIAEACDHLVRIAASNSKTYGSGWTRDYAQKLGKTTEEYKITLDKSSNRSNETSAIATPSTQPET